MIFVRGFFLPNRPFFSCLVSSQEAVVERLLVEVVLVEVLVASYSRWFQTDLNFQIEDMIRFTCFGEDVIICP